MTKEYRVEVKQSLTFFGAVVSIMEVYPTSARGRPYSVEVESIFVEAPSWWEKLFGATFERKLRRAVARAEKKAERLNRKQREMDEQFRALGDVLRAGRQVDG